MVRSSAESAIAVPAADSKAMRSGVGKSNSTVNRRRQPLGNMQMLAPAFAASGPATSPNASATSSSDMPWIAIHPTTRDIPTSGVFDTFAQLRGGVKNKQGTYRPSLDLL